MPVLVLHATLPARIDRDRATFEGVAVLVNHGSEPFRATAAAEAGIHVADAEGKLAAAPPPRDDAGVLLELAAGAERAFPARGSLAGPDGRRLPPGRYTAQAVLELATAAGDVVRVASEPSELVVQ